MSACGSRLSLNRRIDPAVAVKASVRPGSTSVCLVVESGGKRCCSGAAGAFGVAPPCSPVAPDFCAEGVAAGCCWGGCGASSARAMAIMESARSAKMKGRAWRGPRKGMAMSLFSPASRCQPVWPRLSRPEGLSNSRQFCSKLRQVCVFCQCPAITSSVFNLFTLSNDIPGMVSYLDKDSQGRIDDLGAPDPALAPNDEPAIP